MVIAVDYRRAPEHAYPAALDDCYGVTRFVAEHPDEFGVDPRQLALVGDSAGGNLAMSVALKARDQGSPDIRELLLIYPVIDASFETPSYISFATDHGLTRTDMIWFWKQYLGGELDGADHYAVPARASSLAGLPTTTVVTAEFDVLRDEAEQFASRLSEAGVGRRVAQVTSLRPSRYFSSE